MLLREPIETINTRLIEEFGTDINCGDYPKFRVVFSDDEYETRMVDCTPDGFYLEHPEVRLVPKYKQFIRAKYILERLMPVEGETDLLEKFSYEPLWTFQDKNGNYLPPFFDGCKFIIESMYEAMGKKGCFTKYKDTNISREEREAEIQKMQEQLFGNETDVTDALGYGYGVTDFNSKVN
jgi:hypothetical protein